MRRVGPSAIALHGEPGVGVSRFATELVRRLEGFGHDVVASGNGASVDIESLTQAVATRPLRRPVALLVDDPDDQPVGDVGQLASLVEAASSHRQPVRLVFGRSHGGAVRHVVRDLDVCDIVLELFDEPGLLRVIEAGIGRRVDEQLLTRLMFATRGNPRLATQTVHAMLEDQRATIVHGVVQLAAPDSFSSVPAAELASAIRVIDDANPPERDVLETLALVGAPVPETVLVALGAEERALDRLVDAHIVSDSVGAMDLVDRRHAAAAIAHLAARLRRRRHAELAGRLLDASSSLRNRAHADRASDLALVQLVLAGSAADTELVWRVGSERIGRAPKWLPWGTVAQVADVVTGAGSSIDAPAPSIAEMAYQAGVAHSRNSDVARSLDAYRHSERLARSTGDLDRTVRSACARVRADMFFDRALAATEGLSELERLLGEDVRPVARVDLLCTIAEIRMIETDPEVADRLVDEAELLAGESGESEALTQAAVTAGIVSLARNRLVDSDRSFADAIHHGGSVDFHGVSAAARRPLARLQIGDLPPRHDLDRAAAAVEMAGGWVERLLVATAHLSLSIGRGDTAQARLDVANVRRLAPRSRYYLAPLVLHPAWLGAAAVAGDTAELRAALASWEEERVAGLSAATVLGDAVLGEDDWERVSERVVEAASRWRRGSDLVSASLLGPLLEVAQWTDGADLGPGVAATIDGLEAAGATRAYAYPMTVMRMRGIERLRAGDPERAVRAFEGGLAWAHRCGSPLEATMCRLGIRRADGLDLESGVQDLEAMGAAGFVGLVENLGVATAGVRVDPRDAATVLLTDIVGSTAAADRFGDDAYFDLVCRHDDLVNGLAHQHGGHVYEHTGDGVYVSFVSSERALACARRIHEQLVHAGPLRSGRLRMKVAIVRGRPFRRNGRIYGSLNNRAARLADLAGPGETVLDDHVRRDLGWPPDRLTPLGTPELKGLSDPLEIWIDRPSV